MVKRVTLKLYLHQEQTCDVASLLLEEQRQTAVVHSKGKNCVLGLSATHIRRLDNQHDTAEEHYSNCIAMRTILGDAVAWRFLSTAKHEMIVYQYHETPSCEDNSCCYQMYAERVEVSMANDISWLDDNDHLKRLLYVNLLTRVSMQQVLLGVILFQAMMSMMPPIKCKQNIWHTYIIRGFADQSKRCYNSQNADRIETSSIFRTDC